MKVCSSLANCSCSGFFELNRSAICGVSRVFAKWPARLSELRTVDGSELDWRTCSHPVNCPSGLVTNFHLRTPVEVTETPTFSRSMLLVPSVRFHFELPYSSLPS